MKLPVNYGNFLLKKESNNARYQYNKPLISLAVNAFTVFAITGAVISGLSYAYTHFNKPQQNYDINYFNKAQKLSADVSKSLALYKEARPDDINVVKIIQAFNLARPEGVTIEKISIDNKKYVLTASSNDINLSNAYLSNLKFSNNKLPAISNITTKENTSIFTITVTEKPKSKPAKKGGAGK